MINTNAWGNGLVDGFHVSWKERDGKDPSAYLLNKTPIEWRITR